MSQLVKDFRGAYRIAATMDDGLILKVIGQTQEDGTQFYEEMERSIGL